MAEFHSVTPEFAVAPQLREEDFARAAEAGFKIVVCNRPDAEPGNAFKSAEAAAAAERAGLTFKALPFSGPPSPAMVAEMAALLEANPGAPVLAYCLSGWRSMIVWAMAQALSGQRTAEELVALAAEAGFDLSGARGALQRLQPS